MAKISAFRWILFVMLIMITACNTATTAKPPIAQAGIIDLTSWDFTQQGLVSLNGEWEFYWQQLLQPTAFQATPSPTAMVLVPMVWTNYQIAGQPIPAYGYATFRLRLKVKPTNQLYGLHVAGMGTSYRIWLNGQEVLTDGIVGTTRPTTIPRNDRQLVFFPLAPTETVELVIQVANFHNWTGGIWYPLYFGLSADLIRQHEYNLAIDMFLFGSLLVIGLYHFGLYSLRRKDSHTFYFGLFCLVVAIRTLVTGENYLSVLQPALSWTILLKIEYLTFYLGIPSFIIFLTSLYPQDFGLTAKILRFISIIFASVVLFTPPYIFTYTLLYFQLISLSAIFYLLHGVGRSIIRRRDGAVIIGGGQLVLCFAVVNDILYANNVIQTGYIISWGLIIFILFQSLALSMRFAHTFAKVETLSEQLRQQMSDREQAQESIRLSEARYRQLLEEQVKERTTKLTLALSETEELLSAAAAILGANQFKAICQNLVMHFTRLVTVDWIALFMVNHDQRQVIHRNYYGENVPPKWVTDVAQMSYDELELGLSGQVFSSKQPILSIQADDERESAATAKKRQASSYGSLIVVPLMSKGLVMGTITAVNRLDNHVFTSHDVELLMSLATQSAAAIENVRLFEEMQQAKEATEATNKTLKKLNDRLQGELVFARKIQQSLLSAPSPHWAEVEVICYNMPAREIGGDLYAYYRGQRQSQGAGSDEPRLTPYYGLAVGDVTGKGMPAALLMAVSLASFQATIIQGLSPNDLLRSLDETLVPYTKAQHQNCAMCYVEIRSKELGVMNDELKSSQNSSLLTPYSLRIVNAACIPPYIKRVTGEVENHELGGFALGQGLGNLMGYQELELTLVKGDLVILMSDGVIEAHNADGDMLGFEGMLSLMQTAPAMSAAEMLAYLKQELFLFTGGIEQHDDITIVVARV